MRAAPPGSRASRSSSARAAPAGLTSIGVSARGNRVDEPMAALRYGFVLADARQPAANMACAASR